MEKYYEDTQTEVKGSKSLSESSASDFLRQVFTNMVLGLAITGMAAWYVGTNPELIMLIFGNTILRWVVMLAPLALVFFMAARVRKMSFTNLSITFGIYSLINGVSLSVIFALFSTASLAKVFFITAGTFGAMALVGYTTKVDLSKFRSILYMGLIGIIIASLVNLFMQSGMFDYIISIVGVLLFCGLTAYDVQKMVVIGSNVDPEAESSRKYALMGALELYLDFINLFLFLLRIFGRD